MIPYGKQTIGTDDIKAIVKVSKSAWLTQGPDIAEFEKSLAKYCGVKYALACSHGTDALHLTYLVAGLKPGDEVITTPNSFVATTNMLLVVGAKPVFCDIRMDTYNIDETKIEKLITKRTRAIVPVHFAGQPCEMDKILEIARRHKLLVIEDACHALGARYRGEKIGGLKSDMTVLSFHPVKSITTGEGGAVLTNNKKFYERLKLLRNHGIAKDAKGKNVMTVLGYNYRITDLQTALGTSQLKKLSKFLRLRQQVARWYQRELRSFDRILLPTEIPRTVSSWHLFVIRVQNPSHRDKLSAYLKSRGIGVNFHYPAIYFHPYYRGHGFRHFRLPNADLYQATTITLPCYPTLQRSEVHYITNTIKSYFHGD